jgi:hypothetical protein
MRQRCLDVASKIPGLEITVPDAKMTAKGLVRNDEDAEKPSTIPGKGIDGLMMGPDLWR